MRNAQPISKGNRRRPLWWMSALSLLLALCLVAPPSRLCALMELAPGHANSAHHAHSDHDHSAHSHDKHSEIDDHHAATPHREIVGLIMSPRQQPHACCSDDAETSIVAVAPTRLAASDESDIGLSFAPAFLSATLDVFALTAYHGRDGPPPDLRLPTQFLASSRLGRAPPASL